MRRLVILGSTGSIGTQALDVVRRNPDRFQVVGLAAAQNHELLVGQIREFMPPQVAVSDQAAADELRKALEGIRSPSILAGPDAAELLARDSDADMVLNAMVGAVGLAPTLATLQSGKILALANKESLIVGGELVMDLVKGEPDRLVPVDSEHAALAQCLRGERREDLRRVVITASGGPFRGWTRDELTRASVKEALAHPTWQMGPKITIDSATLMNKGLEVIEAHYLFGLEYGQIEVVVHPESVIHGVAEFRDGSMMAQLAAPDMRLPIQLALAYPDRLGEGIASLDLAQLGAMTFEPVDREAFSALDLAYRAGSLGGTYPAALNAANEVAVMAFLEGKLALTGIPEVVSAVLDEHQPARVVSLVTLERADGWARRRAAELVG
ncbi:MAG TPA: 1-deoxy-D-xylulose-5-phosphate reductoisomerase [Actinomycetota bacterium]|jgi:1-deoxy-D-xylulose-5-phosphate reductoisomerase|nr:1-deoxy-D-xylulose-5-phosphate reductoisomerase [Actinomycetota bacterium]